MAKPRTGTRTYAAEPAELPRGTLVQLLFETVDRHGNEDALCFQGDGGWQSISYLEMEKRIRRLGLALGTMGLERGDRVAILSENRPEWAIADYAALCAGCQDVPIYGTLPPQQIAFILRDAGARAIFVSTAEQLEKIREIAGELPALERVIVFDEVPVQGATELTLRQALAIGQREEPARGLAFRDRALEAMPDDVATVLYTSGTTGQPKGVMLTHNNIFSNTQACRTVLPIGSTDVTLSFLPLSHILQRMVDYLLFAAGVTIAYVPSLELVGQGLLEVKPTVVVSTPRVYEKLYARIMSATGVKRRLVHWARDLAIRWADAHAAGRPPSPGLRVQHALADRLVFRKVRARLGGRLRFFISGGAPLGVDIARFFHGAGVLILEGYGLTETSPVTNVNRPEAFKFGTVGPPVPGTEVMIAGDGEILVRGPQVMKGYFNLPEATAEVIDADGWFRTGDIGEIDADGFLRITDRKKDLIVTAGGKNIAPQPIENQIKTSRYVTEAVMLGDRRPFPVLLVVPNFELVTLWAREQGLTDLDPAALVAAPAVLKLIEGEVERKLEGLARYEMPKKIGLLDREFSIDEGELTPTMKVRRRVVEERCREMLDRLYAEREPVAAD